jgi:hypothetical protein
MQWVGNFSRISGQSFPLGVVVFVCLIGAAPTGFGQLAEFRWDNDEIVRKVGAHGSQSKACCKKSLVAYRTCILGCVPIGDCVYCGTSRHSPCTGTATSRNSGNSQHAAARLRR